MTETSTPEPSGTIVILDEERTARWTGEIDLVVVQQFCAGRPGDDPQEQGLPRSVGVVDVREVTFVDSSALQLLARLVQERDEAGERRVRLRGAGEFLLFLLEMTGLLARVDLQD